MGKTTIAVPEGHHVEIHAPMGAGAPPPGAPPPGAPPAGPPPGVIPDPTAQGMQGAMDQALAGGAPKPKAAPKPAAKKPAEKSAKKPAKKKKAKGETAGDKKALGNAASAVNSEPDDDGDE